MTTFVDTVRLGGPGVPDLSYPFDIVSRDGEPLRARTVMARSESTPICTVDAINIPEAGGWRTYVEASVPKALHGQNVSGATLDEVREWATLAMDAAPVDWLTGPDPRVTRLDCVRDFPTTGIASPRSVVSAFTALPAHGFKVRSIHEDPTRSGALTATVRTKRSGSGTLYDKGSESGLPAAAGLLRFEARERRSTLDDDGPTYLSDITPSRLTDLGKSRFKWAGFDSTVMVLPDAAQRVLDLNLPDGQRMHALAFLLVESLGLDLTDYGFKRSNISRYRVGLASIGIRATDMLDARPVTLNYELGLIAA